MKAQHSKPFHLSRSFIYSLLPSLTCSMTLFISIGPVYAEEVLHLSFQNNSDDSIVAQEKKSSWHLTPQGPAQTLDLRVLGVNPNTVRGQSSMPLYLNLATNILIVVDRQFSNEIFQKENCEEKAAQHARGMLIVAANETSLNALTENTKKASGTESGGRSCARLKGRYYSVAHFSHDGQNLDSQFKDMPMTSPMPGLDPRTIFYLEEAIWIACENK